MSSVIDLTTALLRCPSITPNDAGCQAMIKEQLEPLGFKCESMRFGDVDNLWARFGTQGPLFVFAGHTDVVPTGPESEWTSPPFQPTLRNDYLYARGAVDMKGQIAAMVIAAERYVQENKDHPISIALLITSDEEGPAINGTKKVMEALLARGEKIDYCIVGEPSSNKELGDQIRIGRRGSLHGKLTIYGKQGHVAHPHLAKNPIHLSMSALHTLAHTVWDNGNDHFPATTFQISNIHSGTGAANVIPGHLEVLFNFRYSTAVTVAELKERAEAIFKQHHLDYHVEWSIGAEPFLTKQGKLLTATQQALKEALNIAPQLSTGGGTSDGRFIAPTGAEVLELGVSHATAHQIDECVKVTDLEKLADVYVRILNHLAASLR